MSSEPTFVPGTRLLIIGGSPSSGSTLLADILDSVPGVVCGPESGIFASHRTLMQTRSILDGSSIDSGVDYPEGSLTQQFFSAFPWSATPSCCSHGIGFKPQILGQYGTNLRDTLKLRIASQTHIEFACEFLSQYSRFRNKEAQVFCEKTPENIHAARSILETIPAAHFIHVVRHPLFAIRSMLARGFALPVAVATWLTDVAAGYALDNHPRFTSVRYEDLLQNPFAFAEKLARRLGLDSSEKQIADAFTNNDYRRKNRNTITSWKASTYGRVVDCNIINDTTCVNTILSALQRSCISNRYAKRFGLNQIDYITLTRHFGYTNDIYSTSPSRIPLGQRLRALDHLINKWRSECRIGDASISDIFTYINPTSSI